MTRYCLVDYNNLIQRAKHVVNQYENIDEYVSMTTVSYTHLTLPTNREV